MRRYAAARLTTPSERNALAAKIKFKIDSFSKGALGRERERVSRMKAR